MAHPAEAKAAPTWGAPCRMSRIVKSAAPARPSNHTVIWIFPGAFIACSRAIRADARKSECDRAENIGQKMRAESDAAESDQGDQQCRASDRQPPAMPRFHCRQDKKSELTVKQGRPDRMTAGKTVARPIDKPAM